MLTSTCRSGRTCGRTSGGTRRTCHGAACSFGARTDPGRSVRMSACRARPRDRTGVVAATGRTAAGARTATASAVRRGRAGTPTTHASRRACRTAEGGVSAGSRRHRDRSSRRRCGERRPARCRPALPRGSPRRARGTGRRPPSAARGDGSSCPRSRAARRAVEWTWSGRLHSSSSLHRDVRCIGNGCLPPLAGCPRDAAAGTGKGRSREAGKDLRRKKA